MTLAGAQGLLWKPCPPKQRSHWPMCVDCLPALCCQTFTSFAPFHSLLSTFSSITMIEKGAACGQVHAPRVHNGAHALSPGPKHHVRARP